MPLSVGAAVIANSASIFRQTSEISVLVVLKLRTTSALCHSESGHQKVLASSTMHNCLAGDMHGHAEVKDAADLALACHVCACIVDMKVASTLYLTLQHLPQSRSIPACIMANHGQGVSANAC